jgi:hypothetical protein
MKLMPRNNLGSRPPTTAILVLGRSTGDSARLSRILECVDHLGLNPLFVRDLSSPETAALLQDGLEGPGAFSEPKRFIATIDLCPLPPTRSQLREDPSLDNGRLPVVEAICRSRFAGERGRQGTGAAFSYSRNSAQAWRWLRAVHPEHEDAFRSLGDARHAAFSNPFPVLHRLAGGAGQRAKVEVVDFLGRPAVCKTFRPGQEDVMRRELRALLELRPQMREVPEVLAHGPNWIVTPLYEDQRKHSFGGLLLDLTVAKQIINVLERLYEAGYAHLDFRTNNVICDPQAGIKLIDFESAYRYPERPPSFEESFDIAGVPDSLRDVIGGPGAWWRADYRNRLQHRVGLSLTSLQKDPKWAQHFKRTLYVFRHSIPRLVRMLADRRMMAPIRSFPLRLRGLLNQSRDRQLPVSRDRAA